MSVPAISPNTLIHDAFHRPLRDLRISVTQKCNLNCIYCNPSDCPAPLPSKGDLAISEMVAIARVCAGMGVRKIRLTGGEPLFHNGIVDIVGQMSRIEGIEDVAMTTNGIFFAEYAEDLKKAGLSRVTFSLDALDPDVYRRITGSPRDAKDIYAGIAAAERAGLGPIKINMVVIRGVNDQEVEELVSCFKDKPYAVRFIEYMDAGNMNNWRETDVVPSDELIRRLGINFKLAPLPPRYYGETARRYAIKGHPCELGFISAITAPFCGTCTRLRLSAEGVLYPCLFSAEGLDVKKILREEHQSDILMNAVRALWAGRDVRYSEMRKGLIQRQVCTKKVEMVHIGG